MSGAAIKLSLPRFFVFKRAFSYSAHCAIEIATGIIKANAEYTAVVKCIGLRVTQLGCNNITD